MTMKPFMPAVIDVLKKCGARRVLDAPCGGGWLRRMIDDKVELDGIDLFDSSAQGYANVYPYDLDRGLPPELGDYDAIVSCEGLEHFGNPLLFLEQCRAHLRPGGLLIVITPNVWYPAAKMKYAFMGFFPSFPSLGGRVRRGAHMHIMPWSFPSLWLYLKLAGFQSITLIEVDEPKPKHFGEWLLGFPQQAYCRNKRRASWSAEEVDYWAQAGSDQSIFGRRLVVSGISRLGAPIGPLGVAHGPA